MKSKIMAKEGDFYRDEWVRRGGEPLKAYGDGYLDGRCFEAPLAEARAFRKGMVVGAAIVAWAEALRANAPRIVARSYWVSRIDGSSYYDCYCPGCGAFLKKLTAGVDEGTDNERCGACRY